MGLLGLIKGTTRYLYVVCIYGAICLQILFLKHHILPFCHEILKNFCKSLDTTWSRINILLLDEKKQDLEENIFGFVDISHRRYKLRRDVEQTPIKGLHNICRSYIWYGTSQRTSVPFSLVYKDVYRNIWLVFYFETPL